MKVFKFGGASLKDASSVENMLQIIKSCGHFTQLVVVVSAMGKTTNYLEKLLEAYTLKEDYQKIFQQVKDYHLQIAQELFKDVSAIKVILEELFASLLTKLENILEANDEAYDQVVSYGELISSHIVAQYLQENLIHCQWVDARNVIRTDATWREGQVDWLATEQLIQLNLVEILQSAIVVTQGFIGGIENGKTTTLGREGSDFSAAIFAYCLNAKSLTIWKDVPGILNADPKHFSETYLYDQLSYHEAAEMTYYGATVIHPKTIKPLANRNIPLLVRSFLDYHKAGTRINNEHIEKTIPAIIIKSQQVLLSFGVKDFEFITEQNLTKILSALTKFNIKINLMQNSAISFSICIDKNDKKVKQFICALKKDFSIFFNDQLKLITIKNYDAAIVEKVVGKKEIFLEQKTRNTFQVVLKEA